MGDFIKLSRKMLEWEWYLDKNTKILFLHCLLRANWKDSRFQGTEVPRGSFVSSIRNLSKETGLSEREVRTALNHLKTTQEVTQSKRSNFTVFTVKNYSLYQASDTPSDTRATHERHSTDTQATQIEEGKKGRREEVKKKINKKESAFPNDQELDRAFFDYVEMRKAIKKPMTERAISLAVKKLTDLSTVNGVMDNDLAIKILEQSVMNSWQGLFPLKGETEQKTGKIDWSNV